MFYRRRDRLIRIRPGVKYHHSNKKTLGRDCSRSASELFRRQHFRQLHNWPASCMLDGYSISKVIRVSNSFMVTCDSVIWQYLKTIDCMEYLTLAGPALARQV